MPIQPRYLHLRLAARRRLSSASLSPTPDRAKWSLSGFLRRVQTHEGYLLHKYNPGGSAGFIVASVVCQRSFACRSFKGDETGVAARGIWRHFEKFSFEFPYTMFQNFVKKAADFPIRLSRRKQDCRWPATTCGRSTAVFHVHHRGNMRRPACRCADCNGTRALPSRRKYNEAYTKMLQAMLDCIYTTKKRSASRRKSSAKTVRQPTPRHHSPMRVSRPSGCSGILPPD